MSDTMKSRRAELLDDVVSQVEHVLGEFGLSSDRAQQAGHAVADHLAQHWSGQVISYPKDSSYINAARDKELLAAHANGASIPSLVKTYELSERWIRKLIRRASARAEDTQNTFTF